MSSTGTYVPAPAGMMPSAPHREDRSAIALLTLAGTIFAALSAVAYFCTISWLPPIPHDSTGHVLGRDFLNFWMYGKAAWSSEPGRFYDPYAYRGALRALLGADYFQTWSYPPSIMLIAAPFGRIGYFPALLCWTALGLAAFIVTAARFIGDRRVVLAVLFSPAAIFCLVSGQSSFVTAAMLLAIVFGIDRRPVLAGILIGLLTLKPQLGIMFPFMLAASGRWRVFAVAAVTGLLIVAATTLLFGPQVWIDFVLKGIPQQNLVLIDPDRLATPFFPTIFMNVRGAGANYAVAMLVQSCFAALAAALVVFAYRRRADRDPQLLSALFFACSVCGIPYLLSYDTLTMTCLAVMLLAAGKLDAAGRTLAKLVYWLPLIQLAFGQFHIPGPALIPAAFAVYLMLRLEPVDLGAWAHPSGWRLSRSRPQH